MKHRTEQVYDTEMAPLVAQLIEIAQRENIPLLVSAGMLGPKRGAQITCDTVVITDDAAARMPGVANRYKFAAELARDARFNTAAEIAVVNRRRIAPERHRRGSGPA